MPLRVSFNRGRYTLIQAEFFLEDEYYPDLAKPGTRPYLRAILHLQSCRKERPTVPGRWSTNPYEATIPLTDEGEPDLAAMPPLRPHGHCARPLPADRVWNLACLIKASRKVARSLYLID
jgi:hypothetical protein